jgi:hypothetical protein
VELTLVYGSLWEEFKRKKSHHRGPASWKANTPARISVQIIHKFSPNCPGTKRERVFERIFLPIFLQYVFLKSRGKSLGAQRE